MDAKLTDRRELKRMPGLPSVYTRAFFRRPSMPADDGSLPAGGELAVRVNDVRLSRRRLERLRGVCGETRGTTLPLVAPHVLAGPLHMRIMTDRRFPFPVPGLIHLWNRIVLHQPIGRDQRLALEVGIGHIARTQRGYEFRLETRAYTAGRLVWEEASGILCKAPGGPRRRGTEPTPVVPADEDGVDITAPANTGRRFALASGDWNPIHLTRITARLFGFERPIAHGMWLAARCAAELVPGGSQPGTFETVFRRPLFLPGEARLVTERRGGANCFALLDHGTGKALLAGTSAGRYDEAV